MEEKKKRFRPTLSAYRALEDEVSELKEQVRLLEKVNGHSAEEIQELMSYRQKFEEQLDGTGVLGRESYAWREKYRSLNEECNTLRVSNEHMEKEQKRLNEKLRKALDRIHDLETDVYVLRNRGFWARVFNRE